MPNDADSLTEPDVDDLPLAGELDPSDADPALDGAEAGVADVPPSPYPDGPGSIDQEATAAHSLVDDDDLDPAGGGDAFVDDADLDVDDRGDHYDDDEYDDDEYDDEFLFDGDPDDFDLGFGAPPAHPTPGDVLIIDDPADLGRRAPQRRPQRMSRAERRRRVRLQARRVRRIIRHVEPWSVLKISLLFYACLWVIFLVAGFMVWGVAESSGTVGKIESLVRELFALDTFTLDAGQIFRGYAFGGLALAIAGTTFNVLMCLLFNLISDLTGGLRITMIEEETARPMPPRRRRRRPQPRR